MKTFIMKNNGMKTKFRLLNSQSTITKNCLFSYPIFNSEIDAYNYDLLIEDFDIEELKKIKWIRTNCVGEKVYDDHLQRLYIEQLTNIY